MAATANKWDLKAAGARSLRCWDLGWQNRKIENGAVLAGMEFSG
jgi:hypothetical protein